MSEYVATLQYQASFSTYNPALEDRVAEFFLEGLDSKRVQDHILCECVGSTVPTLDWIASLALQQLAITADQYHQRPTSTPSSPLSFIPAVAEYVATMQNGGHGAMASPNPIQYQDGGHGHTASPGCIQH